MTRQEMIKNYFQLKKEAEIAAEQMKVAGKFLLEDMVKLGDKKDSIQEGAFTITATVVTPTDVDILTCQKIPAYVDIKKKEKILIEKRKKIEQEHRMKRDPYLKVSIK